MEIKYTNIEEADTVINDLINEKKILIEKIRQLLERVEQAERRSQHTSMRLMYNGISGLPNHHKMDADMGPLLWEFFQLPTPPEIALILIKLDENFHHCRQAFNEDVFNTILYTVAERLRTMIGQRGLIYHPRLDEFAIFVFDSLSDDELMSLAYETRENIESMIDNHFYKVKIGCSIGLARFPSDGLNKRMLMANADIALNNAISQKTGIVFFDETMRHHVIGNLEMQNNLLSAIELSSELELNESFVLYYQPIITVKKIEDTGIYCESLKAEILIRWQDPNRGSVLPGNLIEVAEETGLIMPIGRWMIKAAMKKLVELKSLYAELKLSINISPRQFFSSGFSSSLEEIAHDSGINPDDIYLEITESCLFNDQEQAISEIEQLNEIGFKISLDDFGTGYSSLGYLNKFKADVIKIDRIFTEGLEYEGKKRDVIKSIVRIGQELGMDIVFEGIEDRVQLQKAFDLGCRTFQGFLFSPPLPYEDFTKYIADGCRNFIPFPIDAGLPS